MASPGLITSFSDDELKALEDQAETLMREALERVMDVLAKRIERHDPRRTLTAASDPNAPDVPEGDGLPPGQPYVSPDDLASVAPLWEAEIARLIPVVAQVYADSAGKIQAGLIERSGLPDLPMASSLSAETYLTGVRNVYDGVGDQLWATARTQLVEGFQNGESIPQLAQRLRDSAGLTAKSAVLVARSVVIEANNAGSIDTARASGLEMEKEWMATEDARTRPTHRTADGQRVPLDQPFTVGGYSADAPGDPNLPADEKYRCRCTIGYVMDKADVRQGHQEAHQQAQQDALPNTTPPPTAMPESTILDAQSTIGEPQSTIAPALFDRPTAIAHARNAANIATEVRELVGNQASARALTARLHALAGRTGADTADLLPLVNDPAALVRAADALAERAGLTRIGGEVGDTVSFDRRIHNPIGRAPEAGQDVIVVRPGYAATLEDGERVQFGRADVRIAPRDAGPVTVAPANPSGYAIPPQAIQVEQSAQEIKAAGRAAARARHRAIAQAEPVARLAADVDHIIGTASQGWTADIGRALEQAVGDARRAGLSPDDVAAIERAIAQHDLAGATVATARLNAGKGLAAIGRRGERLAFDPATMEPISEDVAITPGDRVMVWRQGHTVTIDGDVVQLDRAVVKPEGAATPLTPTQYEHRAADLARVIEAPTVGEPQLLGGGSADTYLIETREGRYVAKTYGRRTQSTPAEALRDADAEELGAASMDAFGIRSAATNRLSRNKIAKEWLDAPTGAEAGYSELGPGLPVDLVESDDGRMMGLADMIINNGDRNTGNWLIENGRLSSIDEGLSFHYKAPSIAQHNPFSRYLVRSEVDITKEPDWAPTIDVSPSDIAIIRARLESLRPRFTNAKRLPWLERMLKRLTEVEKRAIGSRNRIAP